MVRIFNNIYYSLNHYNYRHPNCVSTPNYGILCSNIIAPAPAEPPPNFLREKTAAWKRD
jgi:hypothetical protein